MQEKAGEEDEGDDGVSDSDDESQVQDPEEVEIKEAFSDFAITSASTNSAAAVKGSI